MFWESFLELGRGAAGRPLGRWRKHLSLPPLSGTVSLAMLANHLPAGTVEVICNRWAVVARMATSLRR